MYCFECPDHTVSVFNKSLLKIIKLIFHGKHNCLRLGKCVLNMFIYYKLYCQDNIKNFITNSTNDKT